MNRRYFLEFLPGFFRPPTSATLNVNRTEGPSVPAAIVGEKIAPASPLHFASKAAAEAYAPVTAPDYIRTMFYNDNQLPGSGALYRRGGIDSDLVITLSDGTTKAGYELAETVIDLGMLGAGNGNADIDTVAFQRAIGMLDRKKNVDGRKVDERSKGVLRLPPRAIFINETLDISYGRFVIEGCGRESSEIVSTLVGKPLFRTNGPAIRLGFRDFKVTGNGLDGQGGSGHAFALYDTKASSGTHLPQIVTMERITIDGFRGMDSEGPPDDSLGALPSCAVNAKGALGCSFVDIEVQNCGGGFYMYLTQNCVISNPIISSCDRFGVFDGLSEALRIMNGDIQNATNGMPLSTPLNIEAANVISYRGSGTLIFGLKTKNAGGNAQIYMRECIGSKIEKAWIQPSMTADVPHKGILLLDCIGFGVTDCLIDMVHTVYAKTQQYIGIQISNTKTSQPVSGNVIGNQVRWPPAMTVSAGIHIKGIGGTRRFAGMIIEGNAFGERASPSKELQINDVILIEQASIVACRIANNAIQAPKKVTIVNGIRFSKVSDGGKNKIGPNGFSRADGYIRNDYLDVAESELKVSEEINPGTIESGTSQAISIAAPGAERGDVVVGISYTADLLGCALAQAHIDVDGQISIAISNGTRSDKDLGSGVLTAIVRRRQFS